MQNNTAVVTFEAPKKTISVDLEVPLDISANDLVKALNSAYGLGINEKDMKEWYLQAERPMVLLRGSKTLADFGVRTGCIIYFNRD